MEFADRPNFSVAGVTDWTAVGGHGSDASLRTSEDLARETQTLNAGDSISDRKTTRTGEEHETETRLHAELIKQPGQF